MSAHGACLRPLRPRSPNRRRLVPRDRRLVPDGIAPYHSSLRRAMQRARGNGPTALQGRTDSTCREGRGAATAAEVAPAREISLAALTPR